ncbi:hypothetical protein DOTSEDRAFT_67649 [Dothistroma septosporum NZE10]|uniref:Uncharacterized protein n=1 Tax=Dothistroma septosporum (strain NZE10 / CBS 128990) TaxID=675120 RepID=N1Q2J0_DOTSN|nr:hypothetical protein DOTSEDRAFT_67649 [Dothistroma septosporum NZE10]
MAVESANGPGTFSATATSPAARSTAGSSFLPMTAASAVKPADMISDSRSAAMIVTATSVARRCKHTDELIQVKVADFHGVCSPTSSSCTTTGYLFPLIICILLTFIGSAWEVVVIYGVYPRQMFIYRNDSRADARRTDEVETCPLGAAIDLNLLQQRIGTGVVRDEVSRYGTNVYARLALIEWANREATVWREPLSSWMKVQQRLNRRRQRSLLLCFREASN